MQVHIFRASGRVFGFTQDESGSNLPTDLGDRSYFKVISIARGESQPGVNVEECLDDIEQHGFHVTDAHVRVTDRYTGGDR
jgi:hypothetical protein